ncbi:MAG TPA: carbohydrate kinase family protein [Patescibacteria group bacterium]|nr:carbohydrate kinase family protein [Patescibacteria group bacterium]
MSDVITIGAATLDVFFRSSAFQLVEKNGNLALCEQFNEKLDVEEAMISSGGAATNVAVGLARLGFSVSCIAEIGKDFAGSVVLHDLEREKVSTEFMVKERSEETGISGLLISRDGARTALVYRGAARMLTISDVPWEKLQASWIHLSSVGNMDLIQKVFEYCKEHHISLSWNPGNWEIERVASGELHPDWDVIKVLLANREEMSHLAGHDLSTEEAWKSSWCFVGPSISVVTDGANGGRYCQNGNCQWYDGEHVKAVQETGAGDSFATGFIAGQLMNKEVDQSIQYGLKEASSVIRKMGAKTGLLHALE